MKKNIWFLISSILVLAVVIIIPFLFTKGFSSDGAFAVYLVGKILLGILLVATIIYCFIKETSNGITLSLAILSSSFQLIPLALRFMLQSKINNSIVWGVLILVISLLIYVIFVGLILTSNKKMVKSNHSYEGKEIPVREESLFANSRKEGENE